ncbi:uncharacterized protein LOC131254910 [Magnolia sinica]|uniref:uncharacterized protein LOC131254910 n=1 Tax=Magnolia sinica TaxID=86752 RepID=UPI0026584299|nr:uncharacterized protein LOC131254910 [Magnolia sinica]
MLEEVKSLDEVSWKFAGPCSKIHLISRPGLAQTSTCMLIALQYFVNVDDTVLKRWALHGSFLSLYDCRSIYIFVLFSLDAHDVSKGCAVNNYNQFTYFHFLVS